MQVSQSVERNYQRPFTPEQSVAGAKQQEAIITRLIGRVFTHTLVKVVKVDAGGTGEVGFVNVVNLVQQLDANDEGIPNQPMYRLPYFRYQGGANAVILDPQVGDIGLAAFAMRDITKVKDTKSESAPPSRRQYDPSDGLYIGGFLNGAPKQFIEFLESGINITATGDVTISTPANVNVEAGGDAEITCSSAAINAPSGLTVDAPTSVFTGLISAAGIGAGSAPVAGHVADASGSMDDIRNIYNSHSHTSGGSGSPTSAPSQQM